MSRKKRPSLSDIADAASAAVPQSRTESDAERELAPAASAASAADDAEAAEQPATVFKKFTAPFREEQLDQLALLLAQWYVSKQIKFSVAEVMRLGLDKMIALMEEDPEQAILDLYRQEQAEAAATDTRKFGRSKGAKQYLRDAGKLE